MYRINNYTSFLIYQRLYYKFSPAKEYNQISAEFGHWEKLMVGSSLFSQDFWEASLHRRRSDKMLERYFFVVILSLHENCNMNICTAKKIYRHNIWSKKSQTDKRCRVSNSKVVVWTGTQNAFLFVLKTRKLRIYKVDLKSTLVKEEVFFIKKFFVKHCHGEKTDRL